MDNFLNGLVEVKIRQVKTAELLRRMRTLESDRAKLAGADEARRAGNISVATMIYLRLASSREQTEFVDTAKQRLVELREEALRKLDELDGERAQLEDPSALSAASADASASWSAKVRDLFARYQLLARQYAKVPVAGRQLAHHVRRLRGQADYAAILREPKAAALWRYGQQLEADNQVCCAVQIYKEALKYQPASSAQFARDRLARLNEDPAIVAQAKVCQQLQWCHRTYRQAEQLAKLRPQRARQLFTQIVARSPTDAPIHQSALEQLETLR